MNTIKFLELLTKMAASYGPDAINSVERNMHMNDLEGRLNMTQDEVDAILTDFINFCGTNQGIDYALYTKDLKDKRGV